MKEKPQKRLPQGVTQALVFDAMCRLSIEKNIMRTVSRAELLNALPQLSETTVDDRLRTLKKQKRIVSESGGYKPFMPLPSQPKWQIPAMPRGTQSWVLDAAGSRVYLHWS